MATVHRESSLDLGPPPVEGMPPTAMDMQVDEAWNHPASVRIDDLVQPARPARGHATVSPIPVATIWSPR